MPSLWNAVRQAVLRPVDVDNIAHSFGSSPKSLTKSFRHFVFAFLAEGEMCGTLSCQPSLYEVRHASPPVPLPPRVRPYEV